MRVKVLPFLILFVSLGFYNSEVVAQDDSVFKKHRSLRYFVGVQNMNINSERISNLNYSGFAVPLRAGYKYEDSLSRHAIVVDYTNFKLTNSYNVREMDGPFLSGEYHRGKRIGDASNPKSRFYLGAYLKAKVLARGLTSEQFVVSALDKYISLGPSISYQRLLGDYQMIDFQLNTPLVSYLDDGLTAVSPGDAIAFAHRLIDYKFEMEYTLKPNNVMSFILNYNFNYYNASRAQVSGQHASHTFLIGFFIQI